MERETVDLLFLDIELPGMDGVEFAKSLFERSYAAATPLSVVFTTAYPQYAVEGFRVDAVDFLLKPLSFTDLQNAVEKVKRRISLNKLETAANKEQDNHIFVKANGLMRKISVPDIVFIKGLSEYVQICFRGEKKFIVTHESLKHFESLLPSDKFLRIHKSFLVNMTHLECADSEFLTVGGFELPVGQKFRPAVKQYLAQIVH